MNTSPIVTNKIFELEEREEGSREEGDIPFRPFFHCPVSLFHVILEVEEMKIEIKCASCWVISTAQLSVFLHVYLQPINVVVYNDPYVEDSSSG